MWIRNDYLKTLEFLGFCSTLFKILKNLVATYSHLPNLK